MQTLEVPPHAESLSMTNWQPTSTEPYAVSDLEGALPLNPALEGLDQTCLEEVVRSAGVTVVQAEYLIGDAALWYISTAPRGKERADLLRDLSDKTGVRRKKLWQCVRMSRGLPPDEREQYMDKQRTWHHDLADRSGIDGELPEQRFGKVPQLAREAAELNTREMKEFLRERCPPRERKMEPSEGRILPVDPPPVITSRFEVIDPYPSLPVPDVERLRQLEAENARLSELNAAVAAENQRLREQLQPDPRDRATRLEEFRGGLFCEANRRYGHLVPAETLNAICEIGRKHAERLL